MSDQPTAHRLADTPFALRDGRWNCDADDELRRLHALNGELLEALERLVVERKAGLASLAAWDKARAAIAKAEGEPK
jgi:hypothetical protein